MVADGAGGTYIGWEDSDGFVYVGRIDGNGHVLWTDGPVSSLESRNPVVTAGEAGGVIVAWVVNSSQNKADIYAQSYDSSGDPLWQVGGVPVTRADANQGMRAVAIDSDGSGGAILAWEDARPNCCKVYAQRILANGEPGWTVNGIRISPEPTFVFGPMHGEPAVLGDGDGGALIAWINDQLDTSNGEPPEIVVQNVDADGNLLWSHPGVRAGPVLFPEYSLISDEAGGAIVAFSGPSNQAGWSDVFVQRIAATGTAAWSADGVRLSGALYHQRSPYAVADGSGGAIVVWPDGDQCAGSFGECDIFAQRVDASGNSLWQDNGIPISVAPNNQRLPVAVTDGAGGAIIAWTDCRSQTDSEPCIHGMDIYAQQVDADGEVLATPNGLPASKAPGNQGTDFGSEQDPGLVMVADGAGGAILAWPDGRNGFCTLTSFFTECDVYAQRIAEFLNFPPTANADDFSTNEDTPLVIAGPGVLGNDSDANGDALSAALISSASHGSVTLSANGGFAYTPKANFHGSDTFTYRASDGSVNSVPATVAIAVRSINDAPIANANSFGTDAGSTLNVAAPGVLGNDGDVDGDPLIAVLESGPANGELVFNSNGGFTYTPNSGFGGIDSFIYRANDGAGSSNATPVTIIVDARNLIHVGDLDHKSGLDASGWWAEATVRVHSSTHGAVSGALVMGSWSDGAAGLAQCTTNSYGYCRLMKSGISTAELSATFTVEGIVKSGRYYAGGANHDSDGDSNGAVATFISPLVVHVGDLDSKSGNDASGWWAEITVRVHSTTHRAVAGALVTGSWSGGATGMAQCTTNSYGYCKVKKLGIATTETSATFTVDNVERAGRYYASGNSHDPDGDSSGTVSRISSPLVIHVGDLDRKSGSDLSGWWAEITVRVHSTTHRAVAGALVTGSWGGGAMGVAQCTTNSYGYCRVKKLGIATTEANVTFTVDDVTKLGRFYVSGARHDPDGDSDGTTVVVPKR